MSPTPPCPHRTRRKHHLIVEAAKRVFLRDGYGAAMDAVAGEAGVSKQTVYNHFGNKETLFVAIVEELSRKLLGGLDDAERLLSDPRGELTAFGSRYLEMVLAPESLALHRILVAEAPRFPDLAREVFALGPARTVARLAALLAEADRRGLLRVGDPERAAERFLGALAGYHHLRGLLLFEPAEALRDWVAGSVDDFLRLHGHASSKGASAAA